jgi:hypothetical protein
MFIAQECVICGSSDLENFPASVSSFIAEYVFDREAFPCNLVHCNSCEHIFFNVRLEDHEVERLYSDYRGKKYTAIRHKHEISYTTEVNESIGKNNVELTNRRKNLSKMLRSINYPNYDLASVLDYGGDKGQFIPDEFSLSSRFVYDLSGARPIDGVRAINTQEELHERTYDFIMCCHVLEHLSFPNTFMKELMSCAHENSLFYFEIPYEYPSIARLGRRKAVNRFFDVQSFNGQNISDKIFQKLYALFITTSGEQLHEHINLYSFKSIKWLLHNWNIEIVAIKSEPIDIGWTTAQIISCIGKQKVPLHL